MGWLWDCVSYMADNYLQISIPLWDDCEREKKNLISTPKGFQFHYGMIVRVGHQAKVKVVFAFQFHYGMIVRKINIFAVKHTDISIPLWDDCEWNIKRCHSACYRFQFHYGMIVRVTKSNKPNSGLNFNSTMGWLWEGALCQASTPYLISIPLWDDCENLRTTKLKRL